MYSQIRYVAGKSFHSQFPQVDTIFDDLALRI
jgi:hypothetical protein